MPGPTTRPRPARIALLACLLWALSAVPAGAQARCAVSGSAVDLDEVRVQPPGADPLTITARGLGVDAVPDRSGAGARVHVHGVLDFEGTAPRVPYRMAARTSAAGGILSLSTDADLLRVRPRGDHLRVDVSIGWGDATVHGLRLPCGAVALGRNALADPVELPHADGTAWAPREDTLVLRASPGPGARVAVDFRDGVSLSRVDTRGPWYLLRYVGPDNSVIEGWVRRAMVRPTGFALHGGARDYAGELGCGQGTVGGTNIRFGPATVRVGTRVQAERGEGAWATVATDGRVTALRVGDDPWTRIVYVPGLGEPGICGQLQHAWVPSEAVSFVE